MYAPTCGFGILVSGDTRTMQITFTLCLPRDEASVPVVRHLCRDALLKLGVLSDCVSDIELAVTEACTNVLTHAQAEDEYEVSVQIDDARCEIRISDAGEGFEGSSKGFEVSAGTAESGRGIFLMRALVDELHFVSEPEQGTVVHLVKSLDVEPGSPLEVLAGAPIASEPSERAITSGSP